MYSVRFQSRHDKTAEKIQFLIRRKSRFQSHIVIQALMDCLDFFFEGSLGLQSQNLQLLFRKIQFVTDGKELRDILGFEQRPILSTDSFNFLGNVVILF